MSILVQSNFKNTHFPNSVLNSKFKYSNLHLSSNILKKDGNISVKFTLKNIGKVKGKEVVQLYLRDLIGSLTRPVKELKGFKIIELSPNEESEIEFIIDEKMLQFYTANNKWETEPGDFKVFIGGNSSETLDANFKFE